MDTHKDKVSIYPRAVVHTIEDRKGAIVSLDAVVNRIRSGDKGLDKNTIKLRSILDEGKKEQYRTVKAKILPATTFSGVFSIRDNSIALSEKWTYHTGLVTIDVDGIDTQDMPTLFEILRTHAHTTIAFRSPSGTGIKIVCPVSPIPTIENDLEHKHVWDICKSVFDEVLSPRGYQCDSGNDPTRLCFLAHDPEVVYNASATAIQWNREAYIETLEKDTEEKQRSKVSNRKELENRTWQPSDIDKTALDHINPDHLDYDDWLSVLIAGKSAGLSLSEMDMWSRTGTRYQDGEVEKRWDGFRKDEITWGTIIYFAEQNGYTIPSQQQRYQVEPQEHKTSDIETERNANKDIITSWYIDSEETGGQHLLILASAAGTGKTTVSIETAESFLYFGKTKEEADGVYSTLEGKGEVHQHRSRMHNRDHPDWKYLPLGLTEKDKACITPELANTYATRGHSTYIVCSQCPEQDECLKNGYRSQEDIEKKTGKVIYSWDETVICDSTHKERITRLASNKDVVIVDEVNPASLTQYRIFSRSDVLELMGRFSKYDKMTHEIHKHLKTFLGILSTSEDLKTFYTSITEFLANTDIDVLDEALSKYPISYIFSEAQDESYEYSATVIYNNVERTIPIVDYETAHTTHVWQVNKDERIEIDQLKTEYKPLDVLIKAGLVPLEDPPIQYNHFFKDLKSFVDQHPDIDKAPCAFDIKEQSFEFHLPPILNHNRVVFNTASDTDDLIRKAYAGLSDLSITRHTGKIPAWDASTQVFQISTGNYLPRHSLIEDTGEKLQLKDRASQLIEGFVIPTIEAGEAKVLLVAPKAFLEIDEIQDLDCEVINHHHAEGRNDYQDCDVVFIFHYEPNHHEIQKIAKRLYRNEDLDFTREKRTVSIGSVSFEKNIYIDDRVQAVYDRECRARLMQSAMRLRVNIHPNKIIVFFTSEPVDIPITPIPFRPTDSKHFTGKWETFHTTLEEIKNHESTGDVKAVMESQGVSERTARRKTAETRNQIKADRDAEICRRYHAGESKKRIATEMNIGQGTVKRVLDKQSF